MQTHSTVIITGASSGIGRDLALVMAREGYDLGLIARREELLQELKEEIVAKYPDRKVCYAVCDVRDDEKTRSTIFSLADQLGGLGVFVANAGTGGPTPGQKVYWPKHKKVAEINFVAAIGSIEVAKEIMIKQRAGTLVAISSIAAARGFPQASIYSATKAGLAVYLESLRVDLKKCGITVTSIHPGYIDTPFLTSRKNKMFLISSPKAAEKIFYALQKKKKRYFFPWQMHLIYTLVHHLPNFLYDALVSFVGSTLGPERKN